MGSGLDLVRTRPGTSSLDDRQPRPTNGILFAITVMNSTLASSGRLAI